MRSRHAGRKRRVTCTSLPTSGAGLWSRGNCGGHSCTKITYEVHFQKCPQLFVPCVAFPVLKISTNWTLYQTSTNWTLYIWNQKVDTRQIFPTAGKNQGVVTYTSPVEAFATGIKILDQWKSSLIADCLVPRLLIAWFYRSSKDKMWPRLLSIRESALINWYYSLRIHLDPLIGS